MTHFAIHSNSKTKPLQDFKSARMYFCLKVQKHEEKIERGEKCRRENILNSKCQIFILHLSILQFYCTPNRHLLKTKVVAPVGTFVVLKSNLKKLQHAALKNSCKSQRSNGGSLTSPLWTLPKDNARK